MRINLIPAALLSTLILLWGPAPAIAHEVSPSIADLSVTDGQAVIALRMNAEAFVAGIDLDSVTDTNETALSDTYDALRALAPAAVEAQLRDMWPQLS